MKWNGGQSLDHNPNERQMYPRLGGLWKEVVVVVQSSLERQPGKTSFDDPALLDDLKTSVPAKGLDLFLRQHLSFWSPISPCIGVGAPHDFHGEAHIGLHPGFPLALIPAISKQMQFKGGELGVQLQEELLSSFPVTDGLRAAICSGNGQQLRRVGLC